MKKIQITIIAAALVLAIQARATMAIDYTVGGASTAVGSKDTVTLGAFSSFFSYDPITGGSGLLELNPVTWNYAAGSTGGSGSVSRDITITSPAFAPQTISQDVSLTINPTHQTLIMLPGSEVDYSWIANGRQYYLWLEPESTTLYSSSGHTSATGEISAYYEVSSYAVPETSTVIAGALMLLPFGVSTLRIMRKNVLA